MENWGIDLSTLDDIDHSLETATVPGRVAHIDGDFLAYQVTGNEKIPFEDMKYNHDRALQKIKKRSGAERCVLHLTPSSSNKGLRREIALLKEYQGNRANKPKPKMLTAMRAWMQNERKAVMHYECEADDGMSMAAYANPEHSVVVSKDKDLMMVPGMQIDWDTGELTDTADNPFGWVDVVKRPSGASKLKGRGWKMFWAQMLTGDTADNISGLPKLRQDNGSFKLCGPVAAKAFLDECQNNTEAFQRVRQAYKEYGDTYGFCDYRTKEPIGFGKAFVSEAQLLWMRRKLDKDDVLHWLKETCV